MIFYQISMADLWSMPSVSALTTGIGIATVFERNVFQILGMAPRAFYMCVIMPTD